MNPLVCQLIQKQLKKSFKPNDCACGVEVTAKPQVYHNLYCGYRGAMGSYRTGEDLIKVGLGSQVTLRGRVSET